MTGKVGCLVGMSERIVGCLGGSVLKVDITGVVKKNRVTSGFAFQVIIGVSLYVLGTHIHCSYLVEHDPIYPRINLLGEAVAQS